MSRSSARAILSVHLVQETDFLVARQRAKQIAGLLGFDLQDQTRVATAVSEIARNAFEYGSNGRVEFSLVPPGQGAPGARRDSAQMRIVVQDEGEGIPHLESIWSGSYASATGMGIGMVGARRLMDGMQVETGAEFRGTRVTLEKYLPRNAPPPPALSDIAARLAQNPAERRPGSALHEQNQELLTLLSELRTSQSELQVLNAELEETNRGVLVLYAELEDKALAVQQASEMKTRFLSGVTHELRTPLNSIVSLSRLMLSHSDGPLESEQEKQVQFILRSAQHLSEMVNDLLDLARIEAGKTSTTLSRFNVADLFSGLRGMFRPLALNPNVALVFDFPAEPILLHSDEGKLAQVLRNFISNALKFTTAGSIRVTARPLDAERICFSVADTGVGIAPEHHELVMQEWGQVQDGNSRAKGSGLGLPLSRRLAETLGGTVGFTSELGVGSTFHLTVPALVAPEPEQRDEAEPYILLIDGDEVSRYLLGRMLALLTTTRTEEANSAEAGLAAIGQKLPSLVFLDFSKPGVNGLELARTLRSAPRTRALPLVLYTAKTLSAPEQKAADELELTVIGKRESGADRDGEQRASVERALLEVGLSNMHQKEQKREDAR